MCDALQQNREQVAHAYFEIWTKEVGIGMKNNLSVDFEICFLFVCLFVFYIPWYVFNHLCVISDWFSNIVPQTILYFLQAVKCRTIGNLLKGQFLKITLPEKRLMVLYANISQKVGVVWTLFGIKLELKVCSLEWYQKPILSKMSLGPCFVGGGASHIGKHSWCYFMEMGDNSHQLINHFTLTVFLINLHVFMNISLINMLNLEMFIK